MRVYLVDTENVGTAWMCYLECLRGQDRIILFYTANSPVVRMSHLSTLFQYKDKLQLVECYCGTPNALDFQLCAHLGFLAKTAVKTEYVIVSNDTGYDATVAFMLKQGRNVSRVGCTGIQETAARPKEELKRALAGTGADAGDAPACMDINYAYLSSVTGLKRDDKKVGAIARILQGGSSLVEIHTKLTQMFGQSQGREYYLALKHHIPKIRGTAIA